MKNALLALIVCQLLVSPAHATELFALSDVRVLGGPLKHAQDVNGEHLLQYEPDRLLAPYLKEAGLEPKAEVYPNWKAQGLGGHTAGHYLSALANHYAATGDERFKRRLAYMVGELARCQDAIGTGYVGGVPKSAELWSQIVRGDIRAGGFDLNGRWVPWYNLHKTYAGLRDAYVVADNAQAKAVLIGLTDWCATLVENLDEAQMQRMLVAEFGGMNEVLADVAQITGDDKHLALAKRFNHRAILDPLVRREDKLDGLHANTQVPKVIGFEQIAQMTGDEPMHTAAQFFWETVTEHRTLAFGGNSVSEHFPARHQSEQWLTHRQGPETCNTYNMLRLTELLFERQAQARYAAFYERALFNHILSSQHPEHGGYVYYTPVRPQHYRVYSSPGKNFWCCVGSGMENHTKYGQFIYAHDNDKLYVNLFADSQVSWRQKGVVLRQQTRFPEDASSRITIECEQPTRFELMLRHPVWADREGFELKVNGRVVEIDSKPGSYLSIARLWRTGDVIEMRLPMRIHTEPMPALEDYQAILYGPLVLAAATSDKDMVVAGPNRIHQDQIAIGPFIPLNQSPMLVTRGDTIAKKVEPVKDKALTFKASALIRPDTFSSLELVPFYKIHDSRYMLYWRTVDPATYEKMMEDLAAAEAQRLAIERATLDRVSPGKQQSEVDHNFRGENTQTGVWQDRQYRHGHGWFSYDLDTKGKQDLSLRVDYFGSDHRTFDIRVNGKLLKAVELKGERPGRFFSVDYPIDNDLIKGAKDDVLTIRFAGKAGSMAGGIYDVRLMRLEKQQDE